MIIYHNSKNPDAYLHPIFSFRNKIKRLIWNMIWLLFCKWTPIPFHSWRVFILRLFGAKIGKSNFIYPSCKIWAPWLLQTEDVVTVGSGVEIYNPGGVYLSHHSILSQDAYLCGATHDYQTITFTYIMKPISIEAYAWISAKAIVLPGVTCYEGSILGAGSIASKNLEAWTVYAGNPAKPIKKRTNFLEEK